MRVVLQSESIKDSELISNCDVDMHIYEVDRVLPDATAHADKVPDAYGCGFKGVVTGHGHCSLLLQWKDKLAELTDNITL